MQLSLKWNLLNGKIVKTLNATYKHYVQTITWRKRRNYEISISPRYPNNRHH